MGIATTHLFKWSWQTNDKTFASENLRPMLLCGEERSGKWSTMSRTRSRDSNWRNGSSARHHRGNDFNSFVLLGTPSEEIYYSPILGLLHRSSFELRRRQRFEIRRTICKFLSYKKKLTNLIKLKMIFSVNTIVHFVMLAKKNLSFLVANQKVF